MRKKRMVETKRIVPLSEIARRLNVTPMTVDSWRKGSPRRMPLPHTLEKKGRERHSVIIDHDELCLWLQAYRPDLLKRWQASNDNERERLGKANLHGYPDMVYASEV